MKLSAELIATRGVIASLDVKQQAKVAECHSHLKEMINKYKSESEGECLIALALLMAEITVEQE